MKTRFSFLVCIAAGVALTVAFISLVAAGSNSAWSPTKPYPTHNVYYAGTEELAADEMRVIACGSGHLAAASSGTS